MSQEMDETLKLHVKNHMGIAKKTTNSFLKLKRKIQRKIQRNFFKVLLKPNSRQ